MSASLEANDTCYERSSRLGGSVRHIAGMMVLSSEPRSYIGEQLGIDGTLLLAHELGCACDAQSDEVCAVSWHEGSKILKSRPLSMLHCACFGTCEKLLKLTDSTLRSQGILEHCKNRSCSSLQSALGVGASLQSALGIGASRTNFG